MVSVDNIYYNMIKEAKIFMNGQSQAVRLPKEFRFDSKTVYVNKIGNAVMIVPVDDPWQNMIDACSEFSDDVLTDRDQGSFEERDWLE